MNLNITKAPFGVRPPVTKPIPEFLIEVGEQGIRDLISNHYDLIRESSIAHLFPLNAEDFEKAKQHSSDFFIQICGGRAYFNENRGAPQMIGRHAPFRIDSNARQVWLELYKPLLLELQAKGVTETSLNSFWAYLDIFSLWMINTK
ncbi:MAG: globin [Sulfurimonas sp.]|jgi:hemoglobin|nr:globin [Sulfurimonas sp.]MBU3937946.1 globin [bacterium]MBU4023968.1 globin [bacterium]MBU4057917.1 globin [bacterium]MBU4109646.1 globin [bacterium]